MGQKKTEQVTENSIAPRTGQEQELLRMLGKLGVQSADQLGDLSALANGQGLVPNAQDRALVEQSIGASSDIARRQLEDFVRSQQLGLDETLSARGVQGSSIESVNRAIIGRDADRQMANMLSSEQQQGAQALMQLPFQRANTQLNANQALFQRLIGSAQPALSQALQERLASGTSTTTMETSGMDFAEMAQLGQQIGAVAAAPFTGGMSLAGLPAGQGPAGQQMQQMFPGQGGNTYGLNFNAPGSSPYYGRNK